MKKDDIDVLFTCTTDLLSKVSDTHSWPNYRKRDEKTGEFRDDFIAIGDKNAKGKFSGHPLGSGCEGEFTFVPSSPPPLYYHHIIHYIY